eukprot:jgi/Mesen1/7331/ME000377S06550
MASRSQPLRTPPRLPLPPRGSVATPGNLRSPAFSLRSPSVHCKSPSLSQKSPGLSVKSQNTPSRGVTEDAGNTDDTYEEVSSGRTRKGPVIWKVVALVLLAGLGLYACMSTATIKVYPSTVERQAFPLNIQDDVLSGTARLLAKPVICPELPAVPYRDPHTIPRSYPQPETYAREECSCVPVHNFVILSMQRSGSGWFETLLNNHPNISSHGEIFNTKPRRHNFTMVHRTLDSVYNLDWNNSASKNSCISAVGLKWMLNQGAMEFNKEVAEYFAQRKVSIILLLRRNVLKRLISILANAHDRKMRLLDGEHKSHVHSAEEAKKLAAYKPQLNVKHLAGNLQRVQEIADDGLRAFNSSRLMLVYYEDVVRDKKIVDAVQEFLGVPVQPLSSRQVKIHTKPLSAQIQNFEEVKAKLQGTPFENFIAEDGDHA